MTSSTDPRLNNSRFLRACRGEPTDCTPVWLMRQAGRYMSEYQSVRSKFTFLELCKNPEAACEVTVTAQRVLGVDAAILFADLLPILQPMGLDLDYLKGEGPSISNPVRVSADVDRLVVHNPHHTQAFVADAIKLVRRELPADCPLIGFAGCPFTLAAYAIEGGGSKNYVHVKRLMYGDPSAWRALMEKLTSVVIAYLDMQVEAGVQAIQLFDSWVGTLPVHDYRELVLPWSKRIVQHFKGRLPVIHFGVNSMHLLEAMQEAGADVLGLDWRSGIRESWQRTSARAVQGNLDPVILFSDRDTVLREARRVIDDAGGRPGHIFNLGHGILPETPVPNVKALVDFVHEATAGTITS